MSIGKSGLYHVLKLILIFWRHDNHVGQMPEVDDVVDSLMGWAVIRNNSCPVKGKNNRNIHQANIMVELVIGPLEEGGVDSDYRLEAAEGQT